MLWCQENRQKDRMENPELHHYDISKKLGEMWNQQVPEEEKKYRLKFKILLIFNVRFKF